MDASADDLRSQDSLDQSGCQRQPALSTHKAHGQFSFVYPLAQSRDSGPIQNLYIICKQWEFLIQVDTPGKMLLVGTAFAYLGVVLFLPALNVFFQVTFPPFNPCLAG